jgi:enolase
LKLLDMIEQLDVIPVKNSRGDWTARAFVKTKHGIFSATAPSGKSRGRFEARTLSIKRALKALPHIRKALIRLPEQEFEIADDVLEQLMPRAGANLTIAVSMAIVRAAAAGDIWRFLGKDIAFPYPLGNVIGGGVHGGTPAIQEFLIIPKARNIRAAIAVNFAVWSDVGEILRSKGILAGRNDEGAWCSSLDDLQALDLLAGVAEDYNARIGIDIAASQLWRSGKYVYPALKLKLDPAEQLDFVLHMAKAYRLAYIEDPFHENDFENFAQLRARTACLICGDDLFATRPDRLDIGIKRAAAGAALIKPDQVGTVSKALRTARMAKAAGLARIPAHRSGESCDPFIADMAVALGAEMIKCGISGGERVAKTNRLLEIWAKIEKPIMAKLKL